ncbi:MAG TPA: class I SAM-dependent methyltransferase [Rhizomicrobium sp.]|nr:class I SAM-dependent methyltransferase [Rhizomicrobium sp.]
MENPYELQDERFRQFKQEHPETSFAKYAMDRVIARMAKGNVKNPDAALTIALCNPEKFWDAAEGKARRWLKSMKLKKTDRMIEYGCGSLRLGAHFIRYLDPGCFFGMDVISGFYELGLQALGAELAAQKKPKLGVIDEETLAAGVAFGADIVCSNTVCVHVHPDEMDEYFRNLIRLTARPGARLVFNAVLHERRHRFEFNSWAWPEAFYRESLKELEFVRIEIGRPAVKEGVLMNLVEFEFRRRR